MNIQYKGRKPVLMLSAPYLSQKYDFAQGIPVNVQDDDARLLLDMYPQLFEDVEIVDNEEQIGAKDQEDNKGSDDEFTFEIDAATDSYLCPLCEKSYKTNKGRGRYALIGHLESVHAEQWAKMLQLPAAE